MHDVIVIGAGPAGSRTAQQLAGRGRSVLVLERHAAAGNKLACAGIIGQECIEKYEIPDNVILRRVNSASLYSPSGLALRVHRDRPQAAVLDRPAFDRLLADQARDAGAQFLFNTHATGITGGPDHVIVSAEAEDGDVTYAAGATVLAGGYSPNLVRDLHLGAYRYRVTGVQAEVDAPGIEEIEVYFGQMAPKFFGWITPSAGRKVRVGLLSHKQAGEKLKAWLEKLRDDGRIPAGDFKMNHGVIPLQPLKKTFANRLLVVGDAAGQVKPLTGGGIYYGLLCADIAADTLHNALEADDFSSSRLAEYQKQWRHLLGRELRMGYWARRGMELLGDRQLDRAFRWLERSGTLDALAGDDDLAFDWHSRVITRMIRRRLVPFRKR